MASKIKKNDEIIMLAGKNKGQRGRVLRVRDDGRLVIENINLVKKHVRPNPQKGEQGGILEREAPVDMSNVAIFNPVSKKADRVGFKILEDGRKVRVFKSDGEMIDV